MIRPCAAVLTALVFVCACDRRPEPRQYELIGQILAITPERNEVVIRHQDIKGFMPGMTMPFKVIDAGLLANKQPGDLVTAVLVVGDVGAHISVLTTTGHAEVAGPLETVAPAGGAVLQPGDVVPDQMLVGADGAPLALSSLRGHRVALTFIYTRCPLPDFCPRMDRNFAAVQKQILATPALADARLLSISFDPRFDTPDVLARHAREVGADPNVWTFATGTEPDIEQLTRRFGVLVEPDEQTPGSITHNLRTAVLDAKGRVMAVHTGADWSPAELVADLTAASAPAN